MSTTTLSALVAAAGNSSSSSSNRSLLDDKQLCLGVHKVRAAIQRWTKANNSVCVCMCEAPSATPFRLDMCLSCLVSLAAVSLSRPHHSSVVAA